MDEELRTRIAALERSNRRLTWSVAGLVALLCGAFVTSCVSATRAAQATFSPIRTSEISIVDAGGIVRARLGASLPDAVIGGRVVRRGTDVAGLILYDSTGQERGGYVTNSPGDVLLTLDSRTSQNALFVADSSGATALRIWQGGNAIDLRTDSDGPRVSVIRDGTVVHQAPSFANPVATNFCRTLRGLRGQHPEATLLSACRERMEDAGCRACFAAP